MAFDYHDTYERIVAKASLLADKYAAVLKGKAEAEAMVRELQAQLQAKEKELQALRQEAEYLRMASVLAPSREQIEATRAAISSLVRDIDRCIIDLTE